MGLGAALPPTPYEAALLAIDTLVKQPLNSGLHHLPDYGVAIEYSAMYEAMMEFKVDTWAEFLDTQLDAFAADPQSVAYAVLHNITVPWAYSIGDTTGLFPIAYLSRAQYKKNTDLASPDWQLALRVAEQYVLGWPLRLPDGTLSRHAGWAGESDVNASFLWQDDQFMGLTLLSRLARHPALPLPQRTRYQAAIASQHATFAAHCQDPTLGLYKHGFNAASGHHSCCFWGRANGWVMMAHAEVALALASTTPPHTALPNVLHVWGTHATAMAGVHSSGSGSVSGSGSGSGAGEDGRWHQVLNDPTTFLETSVTAMSIWSMATGVANGWLEKGVFGGVIVGGWAGVGGAVMGGGQQGVLGICEGTGIGTDVAFYQARETFYNISSPGLGSVFRAAVAMDVFLGM